LTILILGGVALLGALWWIFGPGPRRRRKLRQVRVLVQQGDWSSALQLLRRLPGKGNLRGRWKKSVAEVEADCLYAARDQAVKEKDFDHALEHALAAADLRGQSSTAAQADIQAAMLEEMRRLFAEGSTRKLHEFAARPLLIASPETAFWQGLSYLRDGQPDKALACLQTSAEGRAPSGEAERRESRTSSNGSGPASSFLDPPLYLGALLLRRGQVKEALRLLTEANRLDSSCPFVTVQLGSAMIAAGGDAVLAVRALKRALGPKGIAQWASEPARAWTEAFPEHRSYVRKLASKYAFACPVWGGDLQLMLRQGNFALAQGHYRLGQFQEASDLFSKVLQEGAPSAQVLRGLGISLARLGRFDDAFKHLRIAHEMEEPKDRLTAGYLALCGARGKPSRPEDKVQNAAWAVKLVTHFSAPQDPEWVGLISDVFAEARESPVPLGLDEQIYLCEHLWSIHAVDPQATRAYQHLQNTFPQAVRPEYAWLYCRGVQQAGAIGAGADAPSLELFGVAFAHEADARAFFKEKQWDFDDMEVAYLSAAAQLAPGCFPPNLGPEYPTRGRQILLARSQADEAAARMEDAVKMMDVLTRLSPQDPAALDRLACLHHRQGQDDLALSLLARWQESHPDDPTPRMRQAVFCYRNQQVADGQEKIRQALQLAHGKQRADLAFWGARLALHHGRSPALGAASPIQRDSLAPAQEFLQECVASNPDHLPALECLAAVRWLLGDSAGLAAQVEQMNRGEIHDDRFHYCAALCQWGRGDAKQVIARLAPLVSRLPSPASLLPRSVKGDAQASAVEVNLAVEGAYLAGLAHGSENDWPAAHAALEPVAQNPASPTCALAQARLGAVCLAEEKYDEAVQWWQKLDARKRADWLLAEPLANTMFLTAFTAYHASRFEEAAEKLRAAGKLGCRDRRLGPMLILALFRAGQNAYYRM